MAVNGNSIILSIENDDLAQYLYLIDSVDINLTNGNRANLLQIAIARQRTQIALDLLSRKININNQDNKGQTGLHYLGFYSNLIVAKKILELGGGVEIKDNYGNTPLWYAVFNARGKYDFVKLLVNANADSGSKNKANKSPLDFAVQIKDDCLVKLLSQK